MKPRKLDPNKTDYTRFSIGINEDQLCLLEDYAEALGISRAKYAVACIAAASPNPFAVLEQRFQDDPETLDKIKQMLPRLRELKKKPHKNRRKRGQSNMSNYGSNEWYVWNPELEVYLEDIDTELGKVYTTEVRTRAFKVENKTKAEEVIRQLQGYLPGYEPKRGPIRVRKKRAGPDAE